VTIGKMGREYLVRLWDNVSSARNVTPLERRLQKAGAITMRTSRASGALSDLFGCGAFVHRQITDLGRAERDAHVVAVAGALSGVLEDVLLQAQHEPQLGEDARGRAKLSLGERAAMDRGLVCTSRRNGGALRLVLTAFGRSVLGAKMREEESTPAGVG